MNVALYIRVSTDGQTTENQRLELTKWAERAGHEIVAVYDDNGISGAKGREYREQYDEMLKAALRREFDMVAAWSVDPQGQNTHAATWMWRDNLALRIGTINNSKFACKPGVG